MTVDSGVLTVISDPILYNVLYNSKKIMVLLLMVLSIISPIKNYSPKMLKYTIYLEAMTIPIVLLIFQIVPMIIPVVSPTIPMIPLVILVIFPTTPIIPLMILMVPLVIIL